MFVNNFSLQEKTSELRGLIAPFRTSKTKLQYKYRNYLHESHFHQWETEGAVGRCGLDPVADGMVGHGFGDEDRVERTAGALKRWRPSLEENSCRKTEHRTVNNSFIESL